MAEEGRMISENIFAAPVSAYQGLVNFVAACRDASDVRGVALGRAAIAKLLANEQG